MLSSNSYNPELVIGSHLSKLLSGKKVAILGFGREGRSTLSFVQKHLPHPDIRVVDQNPSTITTTIVETNKSTVVRYFTGNDYLDGLKDCDLIIKSPGISYKILDNARIKIPITSQTEIFLSLFRQQVIGITGTKGKSTTVSLLFEILKQTGQKVLLGGNIGVPPFDLIKDMDSNTTVVYEMSSHQLEGIRVSPYIAVLLNIFQEHLDHYNSYLDYQMAKFNIANWQNQDNICIYNSQNQQISALFGKYKPKSNLIPIGGISPEGNGIYFNESDLVIEHKGQLLKIEAIRQFFKLSGEHNLKNLAAAVCAAFIAGAGKDQIVKGILNFKGLPHRLEYIGSINGKIFYNDSISTIPESTIEALKSLTHTSTLILGGFDRGIDYSLLCQYLTENRIKNLIFIGKAGQRILEGCKTEYSGQEQSIFLTHDFDTAIKVAIELTGPGEICLLSPAAASYDMFENFEERGNRFIQLVKSTSACNF